MKSVPVITKAVSSNPAHGEVFSKQHYMIELVSDLRQVGGFHQILGLPPSIKQTEILLKVAKSTIALKLTRTSSHLSSSLTPLQFRVRYNVFYNV